MAQFSDPRVMQIVSQAEQLFKSRTALMSLWQEEADNFYIQRADFTTMRSMGSDIGSHLTTSYPMMVREQLGNSLSSMLRRKDFQWFNVHTHQPDREGTEGKQYLEWTRDVMRRAIYDPHAGFVRATKQCDHDYVTFGQGVISLELGPDRDTLLYRNWHLRDVAWTTGVTESVDAVYRRWKPSAIVLNRVFKGKVSEKVKRALEKDPYAEVNCLHAVIPSDQYEVSEGGKKFKFPFVSVFIDVDNKFVMEETGLHEQMYIIPRWQTVSGSQYAYSPCTIAALPDARLIQSMTLVLLESGEKAANPPLIGVEGSIRSDMAIYAGAATFVDAELDNRTGGALRPMNLDFSGLPTALQMADGIKNMISSAFYLDRINLPGLSKEMTAFEVGQRVQEYIRNALPLFEPMEEDYSSAICERTFNMMQRSGAFGPARDVPQALRGKDIKFRFTNPLYEANDRAKQQQFMSAKAVIAEAVAIEPKSIAMLDIKTALRDTLHGMDIPAKWLFTEKQVEDYEVKLEEQQQTQKLLGLMSQGADVAQKSGDAMASMQAAGMGV